MRKKRPSRGKGIIVGRRCPKIQLCPTCGQMRVHHPDGYHVCPVPKDVTEAIASFAYLHGKRWKFALVRLWTSGKDDGLLRQARNMIGPRRLYKITVDSWAAARKGVPH